MGLADFEDDEDDEPFRTLAWRLPSSRVPLVVPVLNVESGNPQDATTSLTFLLLLLQPIDLILSSRSPFTQLPGCALESDTSDLTYLRTWNQPRSVNSIGWNSIFVFVDGNEDGETTGSSIWEKSFDVESRDAGLESWLRIEYADGREEEEELVDLKVQGGIFELSFLSHLPEPSFSVMLRAKVRGAR